MVDPREGDQLRHLVCVSEPWQLTKRRRGKEEEASTGQNKSYYTKPVKEEGAMKKAKTMRQNSLRNLRADENLGGTKKRKGRGGEHGCLEACFEQTPM